jgi:hypothetical protein
MRSESYCSKENNVMLLLKMDNLVDFTLVITKILGWISQATIVLYNILR